MPNISMREEQTAATTRRAAGSVRKRRAAPSSSSVSRRDRHSAFSRSSTKTERMPGTAPVRRVSAASRMRPTTAPATAFSRPARAASTKTDPPEGSEVTARCASGPNCSRSVRGRPVPACAPASTSGSSFSTASALLSWRFSCASSAMIRACSSAALSAPASPSGSVILRR